MRDDFFSDCKNQFRTDESSFDPVLAVDTCFDDGRLVLGDLINNRPIWPFFKPCGTTKKWTLRTGCKVCVIDRSLPIFPRVSDIKFAIEMPAILRQQNLPKIHALSHRFLHFNRYTRFYVLGKTGPFYILFTNKTVFLFYYTDFFSFLLSFYFSIGPHVL